MINFPSCSPIDLFLVRGLPLLRLGSKVLCKMINSSVMACLAMSDMYGVESNIELSNDQYHLTFDGLGGMTVHSDGMLPRHIVPEFTISISDSDPEIYRNFNHPNYPIAPRPSVRWLAINEPIENISQWLATPGMRAAVRYGVRVVDEGGHRYWEYLDKSDKLVLRVGGRGRDGTSRPFSVGRNIIATAVGATRSTNEVTWSFPNHTDFAFSAAVRLPNGNSDPVIDIHFMPKIMAYYSISFTGSPAVSRLKMLRSPQECAGRSGLQGDFVLSEADVKLPRVMTASPDGGFALVVDPQECRFRLPSIEDSRFGLMLRFAASDTVQPVILAPLLGGIDSLMKADSSWRFSFRIVARPGDWKSMHRHIAQKIYSVGDQRDSSGSGSLNECLERAMDFLIDRSGKNYAMWSNEQKYYDYFTDQTGVYKPFSPLYGLGAAIVTDDETFYRRRALPAIEFALSRRNNVFSPYEFANRIQVKSASDAVGGPYIGYAQLVSLDFFLRGRAPVIRFLAQSNKEGKMDMADALAAYRASGNNQDLDTIRAMVAKTLTSLGAIQDHFLFDFLDAYEATRDPQLIRGATEAAYQAVTRLNHYPIPPGETLTVDRGGGSTVHKHSFGRHKNAWGFQPPEPVLVPEQTVPAWRVSRVGIPSPAYPMEYWMNMHGAILRTAALAQDDFLRDMARNGMVGRFANYPGDNRSSLSLIGERGDAIEAPPWKWNFATVNPGHAWDFAGAVIDYLVSDAFDRSRGQIDFPAESASGSGFRVRVYGARPGVFYGLYGVRLWLPRGLVDTDCVQLNWVAAYSNDTLCIAFMNQSGQAQSANVNLSQDHIAVLDGESRCWIDNAPMQTFRSSSNNLRIYVPPKGIAAYAIPAVVRPTLQSKMLAVNAPRLGQGSFTELETPSGVIHAMLLSAGRGLTNAYVYAEAYPQDVISAVLRWRQGHGNWTDVHDLIFPYEFSIGLEDEGGDFQFEILIEDKHQNIARSSLVTLRMGDGEVVRTAQPLTNGAFSVSNPHFIFQDPPSEYKIDAGFIKYLRQSANPTSLGFRDGRYYPYSSPKGRRIGPDLVVWNKAHFAIGCTDGDIERQLVAKVYHADRTLRSLIAERTPDLSVEHLTTQQWEMLLDFAVSQWPDPINDDLLNAVLAGDWTAVFRNHLYIRYNGPAPDHARNLAFVKRHQK
jgi:hypothetical protein